MRCLTNHEVSGWLEARAISQDPYHNDESPIHYVQFHAPTLYLDLDAFTRHYFKRIIPGSESLVHITDWGLYQSSEMIAISGIRCSFDEKRNLIDAPGHQLDQKETELGISLFSLSASFAWKAYLYSTNEKTTLYNWEGALFDFWTDSDSALAEMRAILKEFNLKETTHAG
jgi:hypothetical protein